MNIDELQQKFNEMRGKKWWTVDGAQPVEIVGFYLRHGVPMIFASIPSNNYMLYLKSLSLCAGCPPLIEEVRPYADWPMDAKIRVWDEKEQRKVRGHFAGVSPTGKPMRWEGGKTSWTAEGDYTEEYQHAELAEDGE